MPNTSAPVTTVSNTTEEFVHRDIDPLGIGWRNVDDPGTAFFPGCHDLLGRRFEIACAIRFRPQHLDDGRYVGVLN